MKRIPLVAFWVFTAATFCSAQTVFYYPQVANGVLGGGTIWKTTIFLTNPASSGAASGTITFTQENANLGLAGSPFGISFTDETGAAAGSGNVITFGIPPGAVKKYISSGTGAYAGGFAKVETTAGTVGGTAIFSEFDLSGRLIAEAGVPSVSAVPKQAIFVDTVGGFNIGVAYINPNASSASVTLSLLNSNAATVMTTTASVGPGNHKAAFVTELFPGVPELTGTMQITSASALSAIALRFAASGVFTTLPPVTLASVINPLRSLARLLEAVHLRLA